LLKEKREKKISVLRKAITVVIESFRDDASDGREERELFPAACGVQGGVKFTSLLKLRD
jgi:hypothetical protein